MLTVRVGCLLALGFKFVGRFPLAFIFPIFSPSSSVLSCAGVELCAGCASFVPWAGSGRASGLDSPAARARGGDSARPELRGSVIPCVRRRPCAAARSSARRRVDSLARRRVDSLAGA